MLRKGRPVGSVAAAGKSQVAVTGPTVVGSILGAIVSIVIDAVLVGVDFAVI